MKQDDEKWVPGDPRDRECCGKCKPDQKWWAMFWMVAILSFASCSAITVIAKNGGFDRSHVDAPL